jgi:hypothetical protein
VSLISRFRCAVGEISGVLGCYAASCGNCLSTFRDNVSVPSSRVKKSKKKGFLLGLLEVFFSDLLTLEMGPIRCPETSLSSYHTTLRNIADE